MTLHATLLALAAALQGPGVALDLPDKYKVAAPSPDAVIARVDGVPVRASDLAPLLWDWRADEALTDLISYQMVKAEADAKGVRVTVEEVDGAMGKQLEQMRASLQPGLELDTALRQQGFTRSRLYLRVASQLLVEKLAMRQFDPKEYVKVSTIVVKPADEQATSLSAALKLAEGAYARLAGGEPWDSVLATVRDPSGTPSGGPLGWRAVAAFPDSVRQEFEKIGEGKAARPVQTANGIQIFRVDRLGRNAVGPEVEELREVYLTGARQAYATSLRERTKIERFLGRSGGA